MNTQMQQDAFPGEDVSDRPPPEESVPGLLALSRASCRAAATARATSLPARSDCRWPVPELRSAFELAGARARGARPAPSGTTCGCSSPGAQTSASSTRASARSSTCWSRATCSSSTSRGRCPRRCRSRAAISGLHLSTPLPGGPPCRWVVELRRGAAPYGGGRTGDELALPAGAAREPASRPTSAAAGCGSPTSTSRSRSSTTSRDTAARSATATSPGSTRSRSTRPSSPPSPAAPRCRARAGPSPPELVTALVARGIAIAPVVLHTGVSSLEEGEAPYPERFRVPAARPLDRWRRRARPAGG